MSFEGLGAFGTMDVGRFPPSGISAPAVSIGVDLPLHKLLALHAWFQSNPSSTAPRVVSVTQAAIRIKAFPRTLADIRYQRRSHVSHLDKKATLDAITSKTAPRPESGVLRGLDCNPQ